MTEAAAWTRPECGDVMPPGFGEDEHLNCNRPDDWMWDPSKRWGMENQSGAPHLP